MMDEDQSFGHDMKLADRADADICRILASVHVGWKIRRGTLAEDLTGIDYLLTGPKGSQITVDVKVRDRDYGDVCLELVSSIESMHIGWTVDLSKSTHFVMWYWPQTRRWLVYHYPTLRTVTQLQAYAWLEAAGTNTPGFKRIINSTTRTRRADYHSLAVCVPIAVVDALMEVERPDQPFKWSGVLS